MGKKDVGEERENPNHAPSGEEGAQNISCSSSIRSIGDEVDDKPDDERSDIADRKPEESARKAALVRDYQS